MLLHPATQRDLPALERMDGHITPEQLRKVVSDRRCYLLKQNGRTLGFLRYGFFWDSIPFLNLIWVEQPDQGRGIGKQAMLEWEREMAFQGHAVVMTSTRSDEQAQHFYRKLGYRDAGCLVLEAEPVRQPMELFFLKEVSWESGA